MRRLVRWLIAPLARWACNGTGYTVFIARDKDGAFLGFVDPFETTYARPFNLDTAADFIDLLNQACYEAAEDYPIISPADSPVEVQCYPPL